MRQPIQLVVPQLPIASIDTWSAQQMKSRKAIQQSMDKSHTPYVQLSENGERWVNVVELTLIALEQAGRINHLKLAI